jgi:4-hydroxy-tetrahydrodipicolinate synthase
VTAPSLDSHQHFWSLARGDYAWLTPDLEPLYRDFGPGDLEPLMREARVERTIVVQAAPTVAETRYLLGLADRTPWIAGVVGWIDLASRDAPRLLDDLQEHPAFRGVRPMIQDIPDPDWMLGAQLTPALGELERRSLTFDALVHPMHLPRLLRLLERHAELRVVVDHGAKPDIRGRALEPWARDLRRLALVGRGPRSLLRSPGRLLRPGAPHVGQRLARGRPRRRLRALARRHREPARDAGSPRARGRAGRQRRRLLRRRQPSRGDIDMTGAPRLRGIFTPNLVPLDESGRIDEEELRRYIDWLIERGVHGLYPNGSTGEFTRFTPEERRRIIEIVVDQTGGRVPVLAGAAEANVRETLAACEHYATLGVRAVAIVSPFYYRLGPESVYAYFREIGRDTPVDVTLYNIPMFASPIDVPTIRRLAEECERIVAIKDSSGDLAFMQEMIEAVRPVRPDFSFLTGWDAAVLSMLLAGCDGGTNATSGIAPELMRALYEAATQGELERARDLQSRVQRIFEAMFGAADFPEGFRIALELRGIRTGRGRQPLSPRQQEERKGIRDSLARRLHEEGVP